MNHDFLIRSTNRIALYATTALVYWVFIFLMITVFDLKIFREHMTELFYLSLLGIFAILGGSLVLNVMSNLSKISQAVSLRHPVPEEKERPGRLRRSAAVLSLIVIVAVLFGGNELSAQRKKELLVNAAEKLVAENQQSLASLADYQFSPDYAKKSAAVLEVIQKIDENFPQVKLIVQDKIGDKQVFLAFGERQYRTEKDEQDKGMASYIFPTSQEERDYLQSALNGGEKALRFRGEKGSYQLYFPIEIKGKKFVLYFSDYQRYGKFGS